MAYTTRKSKIRFMINGVQIVFNNAEIISETELSITFKDAKDNRIKTYAKRFLISEEVLQ